MEYNSKYHGYHHSFLLNEKNYKKHATVALHKCFSDVKIEGKKILEVGCGLGNNIYLIKDRAGFDIGNFSVEFCKKKGINMVKSLQSVKSGSFDIILYSHTLEHVPEPYKELKECHRILKKTGKMVIILPIELQSKCSLTPDSINYHLYGWNFRTINNLLDATGFKVLKNKFIRMGKGYVPLFFIHNIDRKLYFFIMRLIGIVLFPITARELKIIAEKK